MKWLLALRMLTSSTLALTTSTRNIFLSTFHRHLRTTKSPTRLFSSSSFSGEEATDEDFLRWERMYDSGRSPFEQEEAIAVASDATEVRIVSFDLDNTIWKTSKTIDAANDALASFLDQRNITQPIRVEKIMGILFKENKERYCPIDTENAKAPVALTMLRKDAIRKLLTDHNDLSLEEATELADEAFELWTRARHDAIPHHLASSVQACLDEISSLRTRSGHPLLIGAITDGNSDPRNVDMLADYFDFCVNAESVGVGKPDKRVFLKAATQVLSHPSLADIVSAPIYEEMEDTELEELIGPFWIHVGDDFVKDVVAAKSLRMRSIWARELITVEPEPSANGSKKRSVEDLVQDVANMDVVRMQIGASDYLADALQEEFVDATVDEFGELGSIIKQWNIDAIGPGGPKDPPTESSGINPLGNVDEEPLEGHEKKIVVTGETEKESKYCIFCGTQLPAVAKFCSSCGAKQEK